MAPCLDDSGNGHFAAQVLAERQVLRHALQYLELGSSLLAEFALVWEKDGVPGVFHL